MNKLSSLLAKRHALDIINSMHKTAGKGKAFINILGKLSKEELASLGKLSEHEADALRKLIATNPTTKEMKQLHKIQKYTAGGQVNIGKELVEQRSKMTAKEHEIALSSANRRAMEREKLKATQKMRDRELKRRFKRSALTAGIASGVGGAAYIGTKIYDDYEKDKAFKTLLQRFPELAKKDIFEGVMAYYDALWNLNPTLAKNPLVASTFIKSQLDLGMGIPPNLAVEMLKSKKPTNLEAMKGTFSEHMLRSFVGV